MLTTIYLIRHSKPLKVGILNNNDSLQIQNEKSVLSIEGEELAHKLSKLAELKNIDYIYSSNYVRALSTAKYIAHKNNVDILVDERFSERKHGVLSWDELPKDFEFKQFSDETFKMPNGENIKEVRKRMYEALNDILKKYCGKNVVILSHATAIASLLKTWCEVKYLEPYKFNGKEFFDGNWGYCEIFKLTFDNQKLINIQNVKF